MKYLFIDRYGSGFTVRKICRVLGVCRSGYYSYLRRGLSQRYEESRGLLTKIREVWEGSRKVYGSPRVTAELRAQGFRCGENRVARIMRQNGIASVTRKRFKITTSSDHALPVAEDLVERDFTATAPNRLWVSDITYIWTWEGWLYLAAVMDVFNREIVGWTLYRRMTKELVANAVLKALEKRDPEPGLIFHSDRGSQYASHRVRRILSAWQIKQSMSGRGDCFDNAIMESFFGSLKKELVHLRSFHSRDQAKISVFDYIEIFYNRQRRHSSLNHKTPLEYYREAQA